MHRTSEELVHERAAELGERRAARQQLLGGSPTDEVVEKLRIELESSRVAHEDAARKHEAAVRKHVEMDTRKVEAERKLAEEESTAHVAREALFAALGGRTQEQVRPLLQHDATWLSGRRSAIQEARARLEQARAILRERESKQVQHVEAGATRFRRAGPAEAMGASESALEEAEKAHRDLELQLHDDDQARAFRDERASALEVQKNQSEFWQERSSLIASADGKKLRVFAQSLTFGALLEEANRHLSELSRRYSLAPAAQGDLEFQIIDHDMADEVRSPGTLSGGESFLVSLALALGLSELGASRTRVESLFIDEGFGTLDSRSLDSALASLEALQATGRQIGVISHVDRLAAKIGARVNIKRIGMRSTVTVERT